MYTPPNQKKKFFSKVRFELANVPLPQDQKKMKSFFLDYVQLLMIDRVIQVTKID